MFSCVGDISCGIGILCNAPLEAGYRGRAILYPAAGVTITRDATNPRRIASIALKSGYKSIKVDNVNLTPFAGSATTGNGDAGYPKFQKTLVMQVPQRGAEVSEKVIEPLAFGRFVALVEMEQHNVRDGVIQVLGASQSLRVADPATITRQEDANGGAWSVTLQCTEQYAEVDLYGSGAPNDDPITLFETYWEAAEDVCTPS